MALLSEGQKTASAMLTACLLLLCGFGGLSACAAADVPIATAASASSTAGAEGPKGAEGVEPTRVTASAQEYATACGICHQAGGEGLPGAFPPLDLRLAAVAQSESGRDYLVGILYNGLYGQIEVNGSRYNGAMPALAPQLSESQRAGLLNYVLTTFANDASTESFTAEEVATRKSSVGATSGAALRARVSALQP